MTAATTIECPSWCTREHGRNEVLVGDVVHDKLIREGGAEMDGVDIYVERASLLNGNPTNDPAWVNIEEYGNPALVVRSSKVARDVAAALLNAADELDRILGDVPA